MGPCLGKSKAKDPLATQQLLMAVTHPDVLPLLHIGNKIESEYIVTRNVLGLGMWGAVKIGISKKTGRKVAIKSLRKKELLARPARISPTIEIECHALACAGVNPFMQDKYPLAKLEAVFEDDRYLHLCIEHCEKGDLICHLEEKPFSEDDVRTLMKQAFEATQILHAKGLIHRDLKPQNMLMTKDGVLKLCDFGSAETFPPGQTRETYFRDFVSTAYYAAPEVFAKQPYGSLCDVWALGITLYVLLTGPPPQLNRRQCPTDMHWLNLQQGKIDLPKGVSDQCQELLSHLLEPDMTKRYTVEEALKHNWFGENVASKGPEILQVAHRGMQAYQVSRKLNSALVPLFTILLHPSKVDEIEQRVAKDHGEVVTLTVLQDILTEMNEKETLQQLTVIENKLEGCHEGSGDGPSWVALLQIPIDTLMSNVRVAREYELEYLKATNHRSTISQNLVTSVSHEGIGKIEGLAEPRQPGGSMRGLASTTMVPNGSEYMNKIGNSLRGSVVNAIAGHTPLIPHPVRE